MSRRASGCLGLKLSFSFDEVVDKQVFTVPHRVCEKSHPFPEDDDTRILAEQESDFYMAMAEDEVGDVWMGLEIVLGI